MNRSQINPYPLNETQGIFYIPSNQIEGFEDNIKLDPVSIYLIQTNGHLIEKDLEKKELRKRYLQSNALLSFVNYAAGIFIPKRIKDNFSNISQRSPYLLPNPINVIFMTSENRNYCNEQIQEISQYSQGLVESIEGVLNNIETINVRDRFKSIVDSRTRDSYNSLLEKYDIEKHFSFVGLYLFCSRLFKLKNICDDYDAMNRYLSQMHGNFFVQYPKILGYF